VDIFYQEKKIKSRIKMEYEKGPVKRKYLFSCNKMSYDLCLKIDTKSGHRIVYTVFDNGHLTYNVSEMLEALGIKDKQSDLDILFKEWLPSFENALKKLEGDLNYYKKYDSPNGWGTAENTLEILKRLNIEICEDMENMTLRNAVNDGDVWISWFL
jgi:hypothetical protein